MGARTVPVTRGVTPEFLSSFSFFAGLEDHVLEEIGGLMAECRFGKHKMIWLEREPANTVFFVVSGLVKLFKMSLEGREQILRLVRPGDCFGYAGIFNGGINPENAQALQPSVLYGLEKPDLEALLKEHDRLAFNTMRELASETYHYIALVEDLSLRHVSGRLAKVLLEHGLAAGERSLSLTQANMAAMTGTVREMIGKSIKTLEEKGAIRADNHKIVIKDSNALRVVAGLD